MGRRKYTIGQALFAEIGFGRQQNEKRTTSKLKISRSTRPPGALCTHFRLSACFHNVIVDDFAGEVVHGRRFGFDHDVRRLISRADPTLCRCATQQIPGKLTRHNGAP